MYRLKNDIYNTGLKLSNKEHKELEAGRCPFDCHNLRTGDAMERAFCECSECKAGRVVIKLHKLGVLPSDYGCVFAMDILTERYVCNQREVFATYFIKE